MFYITVKLQLHQIKELKIRVKTTFWSFSCRYFACIFTNSLNLNHLMRRPTKKPMNLLFNSKSKLENGRRQCAASIYRNVCELVRCADQKRLRDALQGRRVDTLCKRMIHLASDLQITLLLKNLNLIYFEPVVIYLSYVTECPVWQSGQSTGT